MNKSQNSVELNTLRRKVLIWTPPAVAAIALPAHAQTSMCGSAPTMEASVASKCSGDPPVGQAVLSLTSDGADPADAVLQVRAINITGAAASDTITLPAFPASISDTAGVDIEWTGDASDAVTCLPTSTISIEVIYTCQPADSDMIATFDLTEILSDAIP